MSRLLLVAFTLLLLFQTQSFASPACSSTSATVECINEVSPSAGGDKADAARACADGVTVKCINDVAPSAGYNKVIAAYACKGGVTIECIQTVMPSVGNDKFKAANACGGRQ